MDTNEKAVLSGTRDIIGIIFLVVIYLLALTFLLHGILVGSLWNLVVEEVNKEPWIILGFAYLVAVFCGFSYAIFDWFTSFIVFTDTRIIILKRLKIYVFQYNQIVEIVPIPWLALPKYIMIKTEGKTVINLNNLSWFSSRKIVKYFRTISGN